MTDGYEYICRFWSEPDSGSEHRLHCWLRSAVCRGDLSFQEFQNWRIQIAVNL